MNIDDVQAGLRESVRQLFVKDRAPEEFKCPTCGGPLEWERMLFTGPWSGVVSCEKCKYKESVTKYLMDSIMAVQPMQSTEPALCTCGEDDNVDPDKSLPHKTGCPRA